MTESFSSPLSDTESSLEEESDGSLDSQSLASPGAVQSPVERSDSYNE